MVVYSEVSLPLIASCGYSQKYKAQGLHQIFNCYSSLPACNVNVVYMEVLSLIIFSYFSNLVKTMDTNLLSQWDATCSVCLPCFAKSHGSFLSIPASMISECRHQGSTSSLHALSPSRFVLSEIPRPCVW